MSGYCIVVANGTRARFFSLSGSDLAREATPLSLTEHEDFISTEKEVPGREMWTDGTHDGFDDHRSQHEDEFERRFASRIAGEAARLAQQQHAGHLILVAETRMLGFLRAVMKAPAKASFKLHELNKDFVKLEPAELHERLTAADLLPRRR